MKDFDERQKQIREQFERDFNSAKKWSLITAIAIWTIWLGLAGFGVWVVIMVMRFFGVI